MQLLGQALPFAVDYPGTVETMSYAVLAAGWSSEIMSALLSRAIGVQALMALQNLETTLQDQPFLLSSRQSLQYLSGYNVPVEPEQPQQNSNRLLESTGGSLRNRFASALFYNNFNISLALVLVPLLYHLVAYIRLRSYIKGNDALYKDCFLGQLDNAAVAGFYRRTRHYVFSLDLLTHGALANVSLLASALCAFFNSPSSRLNLPSLACIGLVVLFYTGLLAKFCRHGAHFQSLFWDFRKRSYALVYLPLMLLLSVSTCLMARLRPDLTYVSLGLAFAALVFFLVFRPYNQNAYNLASVLSMLVLCSFLSYQVMRQFLSPTQEHYRVLVVLFVVNLLFLLPLVAFLTTAVLLWNFIREKWLSTNRIQEAASS